MTPDRRAFSLDWFSPAGRRCRLHRRTLRLDLRLLGMGHRAHRQRGSVDADKTPGRAALLCVVSILLTYLIVVIALQMYAGVGTEGLGLGNEEISDNVFGALAGPILGAGSSTSCCSWRCWLPALPA